MGGLGFEGIVPSAPAVKDGGGKSGKEGNGFRGGGAVRMVVGGAEWSANGNDISSKGKGAPGHSANNNTISTVDGGGSVGSGSVTRSPLVTGAVPNSASTTALASVNAQRTRRGGKPKKKLPVSLMGTAKRDVCEVREAAPDPMNLPVYSSFRSVGQTSWAAPAQRDAMRAIANLDERKPKALKRFIPRLIEPTRQTYLSNNSLAKLPGPGQYEQRSCFATAGAPSKPQKPLALNPRLDHVTSTKGTMPTAARAPCRPDPPTCVPGPGAYQPNIDPTKNTPKEVSFSVSHDGRNAWLKHGQGSTTRELSSQKYDKPVEWCRPTFNKNIAKSMDNAKRIMERGF